MKLLLSIAAAQSFRDESVIAVQALTELSYLLSLIQSVGSHKTKAVQEGFKAVELVVVREL